MSDICLICGSKGVEATIVQANGQEQSCPACGHFVVSNDAKKLLGESNAEHILRKIRGYVWGKSSPQSYATIDSNFVNSLFESPLPTVSERAEILLKIVYQKTTYLGEKINLNRIEFTGITYSQLDNEVRFLADLLASKGLVEIFKVTTDFSVSLTPAGYAFIEDHSRSLRSDGETAFVAMWFSECMEIPYKTAIKVAIERCNYLPIRIDEVPHHDRIDDRILRAINECKFLVADLTGQRGGVYFEAGYALALRKPVIWTCKDTDFENIHFDVRQYNCIKWSNESDLLDQLEDRLVSLFGRKIKE
jgi:hypothetical protein